MEEDKELQDMIEMEFEYKKRVNYMNNLQLKLFRKD